MPTSVAHRSPRLGSRVSRAARALAAVAATGALLALTAWADRSASRARTALLERGEGGEVLFLPRTPVLRALAFGHPEALADLLFLRGLGYHATQYQVRADREWLRRHVDSINALDPLFRAPYLFGARAALYHGGETTDDDARLSNHFLEEGLKRFPSDWELAFSLGCNWLFEMHPKDAAERAHDRRIGAQWIRRAALAGGGPPWLASLAARIMSEEGQAEASIRYLE